MLSNYMKYVELKTLQTIFLKYHGQTSKNAPQGSTFQIEGYESLIH